MTPNPATLWAEIFIDELYSAGLRHICISPGSRSTPLTLAATAHSHLKHSIHLDERSAAFFALGYALESGNPAALLCTSGTAAAEYFPAIIEASQSEIPMLVMTADRPPELRHSGANQTIDQIKLYGNHVRWSVDAPLPEINPSTRALRYLRALADRVLAVSLGQNALPGPVHVNFPFRKPLEPSGVSPLNSMLLGFGGDVRRTEGAHTRIHNAPRVSQADLLSDVLKRIQAKKKGVIVAGPRCPRGEFPFALAKLSSLTGYPILADPLSGLRFGKHIHTGTIIAGYGAALRTHELADAQPELILRFGVMPISQPLSDFLENLPESVPQIGISAHGFWSDPTYTLSELFVADPLLFVEGLSELLGEKVESGKWAQLWKDAEQGVWDALAVAPDFEGKTVVDALRNVPAESRIFVANSLPIRHVEEWMLASEKPLQIYASRGVSGIDGTISTALGVASATDAPTLLLTGDLSFFHDQNGLQALFSPLRGEMSDRAEGGGLKITILLINNGGGGIFHRLPVANHEPPFEEAFLTPHKFDFSHTARLYGLNYELINADNAAEKVAAAMSAPESHILELRTDSAEGERVRRELLARLPD
ncbi:MAG: 2-succinyl-5-enolpyruvyl-6-hydroxy-3-cyclohexene-1-carboxylic-acid synthase [Chloroflexi bacterium]|nr:2-succinyl-5-enolpyruvyl-6-hydroxy-3-cyclohexene-1-carboxylic-acid synthase [Chloroflexota bacterium]